MRVGELCKRPAVTCKAETSVLELAQLMRDRHVGDVIVVDEQEGRLTPRGIVTDRDLVVQVMAKGVNPDMLRVSDIVSDRLVTVMESEGAYDAIWHMCSKGVRRLPVVDDHSRLLGVVAVDDLVQFLAEELSALARIVPHQIKREQAALDPGGR
jgi:Predicted signal-transduction protein containing cAMP-binding and CBS domains